MKDWRAIAKASGLDLHARDLDRIAQSLDSLEETFRPLVADLSPDMEPSFRFQIQESE
jgi:hypothetical protein